MGEKLFWTWFWCGLCLRVMAAIHQPGPPPGKHFTLAPHHITSETVSLRRRNVVSRVIGCDSVLVSLSHNPLWFQIVRDLIESMAPSPARSFVVIFFKTYYRYYSANLSCGLFINHLLSSTNALFLFENATYFDASKINHVTCLCMRKVEWCVHCLVAASMYAHAATLVAADAGWDQVTMHSVWRHPSPPLSWPQSHRNILTKNYLTHSLLAHVPPIAEKQPVNHIMFLKCEMSETLDRFKSRLFSLTVCVCVDQGKDERKSWIGAFEDLRIWGLGRRLADMARRPWG